MNQWRQRSLHRRAAEALIEFHRQDPDTIAAQVAHHYDTAGEAEQAVEWYVKAVGVAQSQHANEEAISTQERAIALLDEIPEDRERATRLHESLADSLVVAGRYQEADSAYQKALVQCPEGNRLWQAGLYRKMALIYPQQGRIQESDAVFDQALDALGQEPGETPAVDWWQTWLDIQLSRFETFYYQARLEDMGTLAVEIEPVLEQFADPVHRLTYYLSLCMYIYRRDRYWEPLEVVKYLEESLQIAQSLSDTVKITFQGFGLGFGLLFAGDYEKARLVLLKSLEHAESISYLPAQNQCLVYLTILYRMTGDVDQARKFQVRSHEIAMRVGAPFYIGSAEANQAWLYYLDGQWEPAEVSARMAIKQWQMTAYPFCWLAHWPLLAMALGRDDLGTAVSSATAMLDPVQQRLPDNLNDALERAVQAWEAEESDATRQALEQALTLARDRSYL
jgi:tetratricopeptide (TPR) repeat protein